MYIHCASFSSLYMYLTIILLKLQERNELIDLVKVLFFSGTFMELCTLEVSYSVFSIKCRDS